MASHRALLLLLLAAALVASLAAVVFAEDAKPSILTPITQSPLGSFDGEKPATDNDSVEDDDDAAPVGSPTGATITEPRTEVPAPPGAEATAGGAETSNAPAVFAAAAARVCAAAVAVAAGAFASF